MLTNEFRAISLLLGNHLNHCCEDLLKLNKTSYFYQNCIILNITILKLSLSILHLCKGYE